MAVISDKAQIGRKSPAPTYRDHIKLPKYSLRNQCHGCRTIPAAMV